MQRLPQASWTSIQSLLRQSSQPYTMCQHAATMSAAQTQAVLPPGVLVQKTVTVAFADPGRTCVLWTGVGDFQISKEAIGVAAAQLGLARRAARNATINPAWLDPVAAFGMQAGMVSPFLPPRSFSDERSLPIAALVVQQWPREWERTMRVAISLSLYESLIIPLRALRPLLRAYYALVHPDLACLFLSADGRSWQAETGAGLNLLALEASMED